MTMIVEDWKATTHFRHLSAIHYIEQFPMTITYLERSREWIDPTDKCHQTWLDAIEYMMAHNALFGETDGTSPQGETSRVG
jgi:hypothetical protein